MARITDYRHRGSKTGEDLTRMTERYGAEIILSNATTLLEDAKILRKSRRYARALGLAVLSIEELGKFIISARPWEVPNARNAVRLHKQKQRAAGNAVIGTMLLSEIEKIASLKGYDLNDFFLKAQTRPGEKALTDVLAGLTDEDYNVLKPEFYGKNQNKIIVWLCRGDFDMLKQSAFYVDMDQNGHVVSSPLEINRETTDRVLRIASRALTSVRQELKRATPPGIGTRKHLTKNDRGRGTSSRKVTPIAEPSKHQSAVASGAFTVVGTRLGRAV